MTSTIRIWITLALLPLSALLLTGCGTRLWGEGGGGQPARGGLMIPLGKTK